MQLRAQTLPQWAKRHIDPRVLEKLEPDMRAWPGVLRKDRCAYCGEPGQEVDHIEARVAGGRDRWYNLSGTCIECNRAKSSCGLLEFLIGRNRILKFRNPKVLDFAGIRVAVGDLRKTPWSDAPGRVCPASTACPEGANLR